MLTRILLLLAITCGTARAYEFPIEVIEYIDNVRVVAFVYEKDLHAAQRWQPSDGPPPLEIGDALHVLRAYLAAEPALAGATLTAIELKSIPGLERQWHYLVRMRLPGDDRPHSGYFVVLMSGKVIQGLREPQSIK
jgi:hypothetical protein